MLYVCSWSHSSSTALPGTVLEELLYLCLVHDMATSRGQYHWHEERTWRVFWVYIGYNLLVPIFCALALLFRFWAGSVVSGLYMYYCTITILSVLHPSTKCPHVSLTVDWGGSKSFASHVSKCRSLVSRGFLSPSTKFAIKSVPHQHKDPTTVLETKGLVVRHCTHTQLTPTL